MRDELKKYEKDFAAAEDLIRAGRLAEARDLVCNWRPRSVPRKHAARFANLARRAGAPQRAIEVLWPVLRPDRDQCLSATAEEWSEYAVALIRLGAASNAQRILEPIQSQAVKLSLHLGFAHMAQWSYEEAIPCIRAYLASSEITDYERMVANVNLAAALVGVRDSGAAWPLLTEIIDTTRARNWNLLHKNVLELSAQLAIAEESWSRAENHIDRISEDKSPNKNDLFIHKWRALILLLRDGANPAAQTELERIRKEAMAMGHWETVRDCDFHLALVARDERRYLRVYFATPYPSYRLRMIDAAKDWMKIPDEFLLEFGSQTNRVFDLKRAKETGGSAKLKPGQAIHRALDVLLSDLYQPFLIGTLHTRLFPDDYYNLETGPQRVHRVLSRLRSWFEENEIPMSVQSTAMGYHLEVAGSYAFRLTERALSGKAPDKPRLQVLLEQLKDHWPEGEFASSEAAKWLDISERSVRDILRWALEGELVQRRGSGPGIRYSFTNERSKT